MFGIGNRDRRDWVKVTLDSKVLESLPLVIIVSRTVCQIVCLREKERERESYDKGSECVCSLDDKLYDDVLSVIFYTQF